MASNLNEALWRIAPLYDFNEKYRGSIGYVRVDTWPFTDSIYSKFHENRLFQELSVKAKWGITKVNHRFRRQITALSNLQLAFL